MPRTVRRPSTVTRKILQIVVGSASEQPALLPEAPGEDQGEGPPPDGLGSAVT